MSPVNVFILFIVFFNKGAGFDKNCYCGRDLVNNSDLLILVVKGINVEVESFQIVKMDKVTI